MPLASSPLQSSSATNLFYLWQKKPSPIRNSDIKVPSSENEENMQKKEDKP